MTTRKSLLQKLRLIPVIVLGVSFITYNIDEDFFFNNSGIKNEVDNGKIINHI